MAPSFKISFPLPLFRASSSSPATPGSNLSGQSDYDDSPLHRPGSKAEELLGTPTPDAASDGQKTPRRERKSLRKYPSFMSVTLADVEDESPSTEEAFPFPGMHTASSYPSSPPMTQPTHRLSRHGSSPLLGEYHPLTTSDVDYFRDGGHTQAPHRETPPTTPSRYEKLETPSLLSQQTFASSARDMAVRKGSSHAPSPLSQGSEPLNALGPSEGHYRNLSTDPTQLNGLRSPNSTMTTPVPRRRPSTMDPPTLHPDAPRAYFAVTPPPALINSSLPKPMQPGNMRPVPVSKSRWWGKRKLKIPPEHGSDENTGHYRTESNGAWMKVNVKKPQTGAANWFDSIGTDDVSLENTPQLDHSSTCQPQENSDPDIDASHIPLAIDQTLPQDLASISSESAPKSSLSNKSRRSGISDKKLSFKIDSSPSQGNQGLLSHSRSSSKNAPDSLDHPKKKRARELRGGIPAGIDLQTHSVLNLSSSEDEGDLSAAEDTGYSHRIRASIDGADYSNEAVVSSALHVSPVKPRPVVTKTPRRTSSRRSGDAESVPPVPQIPNRPQLNQRSSSKRWKEVIGDKEGERSRGTGTEQGKGDTAIHCDPGSLSEMASDGITGGASSTRHNQSSSIHVGGGKMMKVTMEEERLLEAMREKRASIRANDLQKGFTSAMQQMRASDLISRPRTAGTDGPSVGDTSTARSSLYAATTGTTATTISSHDSFSPPLLVPAVYRPPSGAGHGYKASLGAISRLSASADDLTLEDSYPFPHIPSEPPPLPSSLTTATGFPRSSNKPDTIHSPDAISSPSLSFGPSDAFSSPPSTRNSPLTPPPGQPPPLPVYTGRFGHPLTAAAVAAAAAGVSPPRSRGSGSGSGSGTPASATSVPPSSVPADNNVTSAPSLPPLPAHVTGEKPDIITFPSLEDSKPSKTEGVTVTEPVIVGRQGHDRHRTLSSTVVVLDGVESHAARWDEENEIIGWALERW